MPALDPPVELRELDLPEFGEPQVEPDIPEEVYVERVSTARAMAVAAGLDGLVVYGDREHAANVRFLTGYDPRFEETLLLLPKSGEPVLLVGNEGWSYSSLAKGPFSRALYQSFSLMGQPRGQSDSLEDLLGGAGIGAGARIGTVGWKHYGPADGMDQSAIELPHWIVERLRAAVGPTGAVRNAGAFFSDPETGLRTRLDVHALAAMEYAASHTSEGVKRALFGAAPGLTEQELVRLMGLNGLPLSCHLMMSAGSRARHGLPSPSNRRLKRGDPATVAYGVWGALNARAGFIADDASDLPDEIADYVDRLVAPYFSAAVAWYETIGIGVTGGSLHAAVMHRLGDGFFGIGLNPGHLIHDDEWVHSCVYPGSDIRFASGNAVQLDIIPATGTNYFTTNIEDGIALADAALRAEFQVRYPEAWGRIVARRRFMTDTLGIRLKPEVLPFSNIPAYLPPFWLSPRRAMAVARGAPEPRMAVKESEVGAE